MEDAMRKITLFAICLIIALIDVQVVGWLFDSLLLENSQLMKSFYVLGPAAVLYWLLLKEIGGRFLMKKGEFD